MAPGPVLGVRWGLRPSVLGTQLRVTLRLSSPVVVAPCGGDAGLFGVADLSLSLEEDEGDQH